MSQGPDQTVIALIWDFDKTLISDYMQGPIFDKYNANSGQFWQEVQRLTNAYAQQGIRVNPDTIYLNHLLTCVSQGILPGLNNAVLRELGRELTFYDGVKDFFVEVKERIEQNPRYRKYHITVEHYIVSTGFSEMIKGSEIADFVDGIWGCEFIEEPIQSQMAVISSDGGELVGPTEEAAGSLDSGGLVESVGSVGSAGTKVISQIGYAIDNTSKTRALFEINKGSNKYKDIDVHASIPPHGRRVPFEQMIYIADGPSDVPAFSIVRQNNGRAFAVYPAGDSRAFQQVDRLRRDGRIDMHGEANYAAGTSTNMWLTEHTIQIAEKIYENKEALVMRNVSLPPKHFND